MKLTKRQETQIYGFAKLNTGKWGLAKFRLLPDGKTVDYFDDVIEPETVANALNDNGYYQRERRETFLQRLNAFPAGYVLSIFYTTSGINDANATRHLIYARPGDTSPAKIIGTIETPLLGEPDPDRVA